MNLVFPRRKSGLFSSVNSFDNTYRTDNVIYQIDNHTVRVIRVIAILDLKSISNIHKRLFYVQKRIARIGNRLNKGKFHGGHLIANCLGGISEDINIVPMGEKTNQGEYKNMEEDVKKLVEQGRIINLDINVVYPIDQFDTLIPERFVVSVSEQGRLLNIYNIVNIF